MATGTTATGPARSGDPAVGAPAADDELAAAVYRGLAHTLRWLRQAGTSAGVPASVGHGGLSALATVSRTGPVRSGVLAEHERVTASTMSRIVDSLVAQELTERVADPADGRAYLVRLTGPGAELVERVRVARSRALRERLARMSPADRAALSAALPALSLLADD